MSSLSDSVEAFMAEPVVYEVPRPWGVVTVGTYAVEMYDLHPHGYAPIAEGIPFQRYRSPEPGKVAVHIATSPGRAEPFSEVLDENGGWQVLLGLPREEDWMARRVGTMKLHEPAASPEYTQKFAISNMLTRATKIKLEIEFQDTPMEAVVGDIVTDMSALFQPRTDDTHLRDPSGTDVDS